jgi:anaerobic magnesium-protoporphyrin IX monomethyl ester cyclase
MKALLINPPTGRYMRSDRCQAPVDSRVAEPPRPPMDLAYCAAALEKIGVECKIKDYPMQGQGWPEAIADLNSFKPGMLFISTTTPTIEDDLTICGAAKKINPKMLTVAKGAHLLVFDKEILTKFKHLDVAVRGEPEIIIQGLVNAEDYSGISGITYKKDSKIIRNPDKPFEDNLDNLPFPARHLLNNRLYRTPDSNDPIAFINTGRGCPYKCIFCAAGLVSGYKVRIRSVGSVVLEIEECIRLFDIETFFFAADTFTYDKQWVIDLCCEILKRGIKIRWGANSRIDTLDEETISWMSKAGCYVIGFGAESGSQFMLDKMGKNITLSQIQKALDLCKKYYIESFLVFVIGLPWETKETVDDTIKFVKNIPASFIEVNIAYPIPGTVFHNIARENGLFKEENLFGHNYSFPLVRSFSLTTDELRSSRKKILKAFYLRPDYIVKRTGNIKSLKSALNYFKYGLRLINNLLNT